MEITLQVYRSKTRVSQKCMLIGPEIRYQQDFYNEARLRLRPIVDSINTSKTEVLPKQEESQDQSRDFGFQIRTKTLLL